MLHGILDYPPFGPIARRRCRNLEPAIDSATLSAMDTSETTDAASEFKEIRHSEVAMNPDNPPWNSFLAFMVWVGSVALIIVIPMMIVLPYVFANVEDARNPVILAEFVSKDPVSILLQIAAIIPAHLLTLLLCWLVVTNGRKYPFLETLGWKSGGMRWWHYVAVLGSFMGLAIVVGYFIPEQDNELLRILKSSRTAVYLVAFLAVFTAPLVEELVYRGVLYSAFQRSVGTTLSVVIVTVLFAVVHVPQYLPSVSTILLLTVLSLILTLVRVKTGNLLPCVILHTIFNALQSAFLLAEPYLEQFVPPNPESVAVLFIK